MLLDLLKEVLSKEAPVHRKITTTTQNESSSENTTTGVYSIAEDSWWKILDTRMIVEEPTNPMFKLQLAPTVAEGKANYTQQKFDFAEKFDLPVFEGGAKKNMRYANGTIKKNCDGTPIV